MINTLVSPNDEFYINEGRSSNSTSPTKRLRSSVDHRQPLDVPEEDYYDVVDDPPPKPRPQETRTEPGIVEETYDQFDNLLGSYKAASTNSSPIISTPRNKPITPPDMNKLLRKPLPLSASSSPVIPRSNKNPGPPLSSSSEDITLELQKKLRRGKMDLPNLQALIRPPIPIPASVGNDCCSNQTANNEMSVKERAKFLRHQMSSSTEVVQTKLVSTVEAAEDSPDGNSSDRYGFLQLSNPDKRSNEPNQATVENDVKLKPAAVVAPSPSPPPPASPRVRKHSKQAPRNIQETSTTLVDVSPQSFDPSSTSPPPISPKMEEVSLSHEVQWLSPPTSPHRPMVPMNLPIQPPTSKTAELSPPPPPLPPPLSEDHQINVNVSVSLNVAVGTRHQAPLKNPLPKPKPKPKQYKMVSLEKEDSLPKPPPVHKKPNYQKVSMMKNSDSTAAVVLQLEEKQRERLGPSENKETNNNVHVSSSAGDEGPPPVTHNKPRPLIPPTSHTPEIRAKKNDEDAKFSEDSKNRSLSAAPTTLLSLDRTITPQESGNDDDENEEEVYISSSADPPINVATDATTKPNPSATPPTKHTPEVPLKRSNYEKNKLNIERERAATVLDPKKLPQYEPTQPARQVTESTGSKEYKPRLEALRKKVEEKKNLEGVSVPPLSSPAPPFSSGAPPPSYPAPPVPTVDRKSPAVPRKPVKSAHSMSQTDANSSHEKPGQISHSKSMEIEKAIISQRKNYTTHTLPHQNKHGVTTNQATPPPLPPRTDDMLEFSSSESLHNPHPPPQPGPLLQTSSVTERPRSKTTIESTPSLSTNSVPPKNRKNYLDIVKKVFTSKDKGDEQQEQSSQKPLKQDDSLPAEVPKPKFVRMKGRPLPAAPEQSLADDIPEDPTADYEPVDDMSSLMRSPPPRTSPSPHHNRARLPLPPRVAPPDPSILNDPEQMRAFITQLMFQNQPPSTGMGPSHSPTTKPHRSQSMNYHHQVYHSDVDADGYEKTDDWVPPTRYHFTPPRYPSVDGELEYHYPELRGCRKGRAIAPPRSASTSPRKAKPRAPTPPMREEDVDDYMNMQGGGAIDELEYENFEMINSLRTGGSFDSSQVSPSKKFVRRNSMDDIHIYYNTQNEDGVRFPSGVVPPRKSSYEQQSTSFVTTGSGGFDQDVDEETGQKQTEMLPRQQVKAERKPRPLPPRNKPRLNYTGDTTK